jgi:hypothetical protein
MTGNWLTYIAKFTGRTPARIFMEFWSRQDAIRFGTFGDARIPDKKKDKDAHFELFPIPASADIF